MKKASIIFGIGSLLLFGCTYFFMQKSAHLINENNHEEEALELHSNASRAQASSNWVTPDDKDEYYYKDMKLNQADHITINNCLQYYINEKSFVNANRCEESIVDAIVTNIGESNFFKAILGSAINYTQDVSIKTNFIRTLFSTPTHQTSLKSKIIITFLNRFRAPEQLQSAIDHYKGAFMEDITINLFNKLFKNQINLLVDSYDTIQEQEDKEAFFRSIYYEAETKNRHAEFWEFTFWKRRELEKNDTLIYAILKEIKTYYPTNI